MKELLTGSTRCLLVYPASSSENFQNFTSAPRFVGAKYMRPPLGLMTVAALLPQHWQFRLVDENIRPLGVEDLEWADFILVGGMLSQQRRVLAIIDLAHDAGKPVVLGGPDPTAQPEVYRKADFLVLGEGEVTIPLFLQDLSHGATSGVYQPDRWADMSVAVVPRFDLIRLADYVRVDVQFSRGCPYNCEFCNVIELFGRRPRSKSPGQMLVELQTLYDLGYRGNVNLLDDNFLGSRKQGVPMLRALREWSSCHRYPFYFSTSASINLVQDKELMELMQENDFRIVFVGIESPDENVLLQIQKRHNTGISVVDAMRTLGAHGMSVVGGFILGFDDEIEDTAQQMIDLIQDTGICLAYAGMLVALPNTQLTNRLQLEGRLYDMERFMQGAIEGDNTVNGPNFVTVRPRTAIMRDFLHVMREVYDPQKYYERVLCTATNMAPNYRHRLDSWETFKLLRGFIMVSATAGFNRQTALLYWKTLLTVLAKNPRVVGLVVNMAAVYVDFTQHVTYIAHILEEQAEYIERIGEDNYNQLMLAKVGQMTQHDGFTGDQSTAAGHAARPSSS
jgi:radical SAM superfamily enzyme YgiQ (UPF0313 family)